MLRFLMLALLTVAGLAACADRSSGMIASDSPSQPPVGPGDQGAVDPGTGGAPTGGNCGNNGGGTPQPSGSPVPEPGTMLLVGTGLAGAALLTRRRRSVPSTASAPGALCAAAACARARGLPPADCVDCRCRSRSRSR